MSRDREAKLIASWMKGCNICSASTAAFSRWREQIQAMELDPMELCRRVLVELGLPQIMANPLVAASFQASLREEVRDQRDLLNI